MKVHPAGLPQILLIEPKVFTCQRSELPETWVSETYEELGIVGDFIQDNFSRPNHRTLRELHFQEPNPQGKLLTVLHGQIFDVVVDVRTDIGHNAAIELAADAARQLWVPPVFSHGLCVLNDFADCAYKCAARYDPDPNTL